MQSLINSRSHAGVIALPLGTDDGGLLLPDDIIQDAIEEFGQDGGYDVDEIDIEAEMDEHAEVRMKEGDRDMEE
jgi:hypothetical protein